MDFNKEEVEKLIIDVKAKVFGDALDRNLSTKDAVEEVQKVEKETREFLEKEEVKETVKELKKINKKLKKVEEKQKKLEEEAPGLKITTESENVDDVDKNKLEEYQKLQKEKEELTREGIFASQFMYEYTENYAAEHGWGEDVKKTLQQAFDKLGGFVSNVLDKVTGEKAEAMGVVKSIAQGALVVGVKTKPGKKFIGFLVRKLLEQGLSQGKIAEVLGEMGVNLPSDTTGTESIDEYDDILPGIFERSSKKSSTSTPSRSNINFGGGSAMPPDPEKEPRKSSTEDDLNNYLDGLKGKLSKKGITKDGYEYYKVVEKIEYKGIKFKKGDYLSRDELHNEWEWFRGKDTHKGAIDPITGKLFEDSAVKSRSLKLP